MTSCSDNIAGKYCSDFDDNYCLLLKEDGTYEYLNGKQIYNSGKWYSKRKGWVKVYLYNWKDIPEFNIFDCNSDCAVFINYNAGELEFQPDLSMYNFSKIGEE